jgi:predicted ATPase/DNA-binding SARP family transcriptional activator/Tfp pilus assembly protein PilF
MGYARLLGPPHLRFDGDWIEPPRGKATALLLYLAYEGGWCSRDELLLLFYPDAAEDAARTNLRQLLHSARRLPHAQGLEVEGTRLRWPIDTDVQGFEQAVAEGRWARALESYGGDLLEGVALADAPEFEAWLELERAGLRGSWLTAATRRAMELMAADRHAEAATLTVFSLNDPDFREDVFHLHMSATYLAGNRAQALAAYRRFAGRMRSELGLEPTSTTERLAHAVQTDDDALLRLAVGLDPAPQAAGRTATAATVATAAASVSAPARAGPAPLPRATGTFVERPELAIVHEILRRPDCRLLTLLGPGGVGKTRLALELAHEARAGSGFGRHLYFLGLESLSEAEDVPSSLLSALSLGPVARDEEPLAQVVARLRDAPALLVLDNLEHLPGAVAWVSLLLRDCAELKVLATSRERLRLVEEWIFPIEGLGAPGPDVDFEDALDHPAVRLFSQAARRVKYDFRIEPHDLPQLARLLRLVGGLPLAIELAAVWVRMMPLAQIAEEIAADVDVLTTTVLGLPERHRSIRAAFEHSWRLLSPGEREVLKRLSVFRGGFTPEAALEVAGARLPFLAALVDKSLVRLTKGRYDRHPLLYQYALEKLDEDPPEACAARERHATYFVRLAEEGLHGAEGFERLEAEHDNLRRALAWAEATQHADLGQRLAAALFWFWWARGHVREGRAWLERMLALAPGARTVSRCGALLNAAGLMYMQAELEAAHDLNEEALGIAHELGDEVRVALALNGRGVIAFDRGEYEEARRDFEACLETMRVHGALRGARTLVPLGSIAFMQGDHDRARALYEEALALALELGDMYTIAGALGWLGLIARREGEEALARSRLEESLSIARAAGEEGMVVVFLWALGTLACDRGDLTLARDLQAESLRTAWEFGILKYLNTSFEAIATIMLSEERFEPAAQLWGAAEAFRDAKGIPIQPYRQAEYEEAVAALRASLDESRLRAAWQRGRAMPLAQAVAYAREAVEGGPTSP